MPAPSHYLNRCWHIVNWILREKLQWNRNCNWNILLQENAFENVVWKTAAILSQPQWVKQSDKSFNAVGVCSLGNSRRIFLQKSGIRCLKTLRALIVRLGSIWSWFWTRVSIVNVVQNGFWISYTEYTCGNVKNKPTKWFIDMDNTFPVKVLLHCLSSFSYINAIYATLRVRMTFVMPFLLIHKPLTSVLCYTFATNVCDNKSYWLMWNLQPVLEKVYRGNSIDSSSYA